MSGLFLLKDSGEEEAGGDAQDADGKRLQSILEDGRSQSLQGIHMFQPYIIIDHEKDPCYVHVQQPAAVSFLPDDGPQITAKNAS